MERLQLKVAIACALLIAIVFLNMVSLNSVTAQPELVNARIVVQVSNVNPLLKTANVNLFLYINNYPLNASDVRIMITGGGDVIVPCYNKGEDANGWFFQGESNETTWFLDGIGETYPFDSYTLHFKIHDTFMPTWLNCSLTMDGSQAYFDGPNSLSLTTLWVENNGLISMTETSAWLAENETTNQMNVHINRTSDALNSVILELFAPIIACYLLLATTLLLDPKKHMNERLTIYLALFVFVPTFLFAIQNYLPFRSSLSFPELLLSNLVISTTIFAVFSIIGKFKTWTLPWNVRIHHNVWDLLAVLSSLILLLLTYYATLFGKINPAASFVFSYCIIPAFMIWFPFENFKHTTIKGNKSVLAFLFSLFLMLFWAFIAWYFNSVFTLIIGGVFCGTFVGVYLDKEARVAITSGISVIVSVIMAGGVISIANSFLGTPFTEVYSGILLLGLWGYPIGVLAAATAIIQSRVKYRLNNRNIDVKNESEDGI